MSTALLILHGPYLFMLNVGYIALLTLAYAISCVMIGIIYLRGAFREWRTKDEKIIHDRITDINYYGNGMYHL